jgi:hypothetical protein
MEKDLRKMYAPIFEVSLHLRVPDESESSEHFEEGLHESDQGPKEWARYEEDVMSENENISVKYYSNEELLLEGKKPKTSAVNFEGILSGKTVRVLRMKRNILTARK